MFTVQTTDHHAIHRVDPELPGIALVLEDDTCEIEVHPNNDERPCQHCGDPVVEYSEGWVHERGDSTIGDEDLCGRLAHSDLAGLRDDELDGYTLATPTRDVRGLFNWAGVEVTENEVRVQISVADPRGCFQMTLRRGGEHGELVLLHLPHEGETTPHAPLRELHTGTFVVGA